MIVSEYRAACHNNINTTTQSSALHSIALTASNHKPTNPASLLLPQQQSLGLPAAMCKAAPQHHSKLRTTQSLFAASEQQMAHATPSHPE
jgi:hypothetical protein